MFLLTKRPRYWFDAEAVREPSDATGPTWEERKANGEAMRHGLAGAAASGSGGYPAAPGGRNVRSVWQIATQPYPEAHFATFPEELARRCILAGCPVRVCGVCGKPSERIVERELGERTGGHGGRAYGSPDGMVDLSKSWVPRRVNTQTLGWSDCGHNNWRPGVALDPFVGSGTVAKVARDHQRHAIGIDLSAEYLELAARRLQQLSLLT